MNGMEPPSVGARVRGWDR